MVDKDSKRKALGKGALVVRGRGYAHLVGGISSLLEEARRGAVRAVNVVMTATYWEIGRRIVLYEQKGERRAEYGLSLLDRLSGDLAARFGRGFSLDNLENMRLFYLSYYKEKNSETVSRKSGLAKKSETLSRKSFDRSFHEIFPLTWSHYVLLVRRTGSEHARRFYETEALRGGWSVRQLERQINSQFYERTALSRNKAAMLIKGQARQPQDMVSVEEEIKDPYILEFLDLKDEYSESDLEQALSRKLEAFLLELGGEFCFIGRQKRLRIGGQWYRVDLLFFHRTLRCLMVVDLKLGRFTHADAGQMHLYLNYAAAHWMRPGENPPVGLILCSQNDEALARYALDNLPNKVLAAEYKTILPDEKSIIKELTKTRAVLDARIAQRGLKKRNKKSK